ncbi:MAG: uracil-DNA glycosylase family protein [Capsulimonadaceae bacterium]|nr:uracil-DNA glycosylase family protein [Capsulimonadaceae bacterium]
MNACTQPAIEPILAAIGECRKCADQGYPIVLPPLVRYRAVEPQVPAPFVVIGQAPSLTDLRVRLTYQGPAAQRLMGWLRDAGFADTEIGTRVYMTALTKCFPGRLPGKSTDRAPSQKERGNCRSWLDGELAILSPRVVIPFGKMAIDTFLGPAAPLGERIGRRFDKGEVVYIPLPHSSGASTWLNSPGNQALLSRAIELIGAERTRI